MMILDFRLSFKLLQGKKQIAISHDHHLEFAHKKNWSQVKRQEIKFHDHFPFALTFLIIWMIVNHGHFLC